VTGVESRHADLGDVRLHHVTAGSGPPVVLLHGWPQTWFCWRGVIPLLAEHHTVIAPDLRGLGDSSRPASGYDKRTLAGDVRRLVVDHLGFAGFHLVGHDWGGATAYSLAAHFPEAVETLAVLDVTIPGSAGVDVSQGGRRWHHAFHRTAGLPEALVGGREAVYLRWFYDTLGHRPGVVSDEDLAEYVRTYSEPGALHAGFELYRATPQDIEDNRAVAARGKLPMPVLAVGGGAGWGRGSEVEDSLRPLADDVRGVVIDQAGHWIPDEQPERLAGLLLAHFAGVRTPQDR
jgi:pimeloyl-ACP methyl ester carboxylesterase